MYEPYTFSMFLRHYAPGFRRLGEPIKVRDAYGPQHIRDKKFTLAKTKDEIVEEYSLVLQTTYKRTALGVAAWMVGAWALLQVVATGSDFYLMLAMVGIAWGSYKFWHAGAAYSNYQEFELRPILVPIEDVREPSMTPHWLTGKPKPTIEVAKVVERKKKIVKASKSGEPQN
ncbi:MAG: hypothetical protein QW343_01855 [Candidatus Norongarragalinales archaeon]